MSSTTTMTARPRRFTTAVLFAVGFLSALLLSRLLNDVETLESGARDVHEKQAVEKIPFQPKPKHPSNHTSSSDTGNKTTFKSNGDVGSPVKAKLSDYINTNTYEIQADVSNLLDFAIVGNPKTGTTFLIQWLNLHPQLWLHPHEIRVFDEKARGPGLMVEAMFPPYANNSDHKRLGYKYPADIRSAKHMSYFRDYFPRTRVIVGVRHPVWWFQSFYNYRIREERPMPPPLECRGACERKHYSVCTHNAYFHVFLAQLGRTRGNTQKERDLLSTDGRPFHTSVLRPAMANNIFLYEQTQLSGYNEPEIAKALRLDLSKFLAISPPLPSLDDAREVPHARDISRDNVIDICQPDYQILREELTMIGRDASEWILEYFVNQPNVVVSSPEYFAKALESWKEDPCVQTN